MRRTIIILLVFIIIFPFSACAEGLSEKSSLEETESSYSGSEESGKSEEPVDKWAERIANSRKKVYEMLEENPDALKAVPNKSTNEPVPTQSIDDLPECISEWAYNYFNYRVTFEVSDYFEYDGEIGCLLRFLTAIQRIKSEPADTFELVVSSSDVSYPTAGKDWMLASVNFTCNFKKYDNEKDKYIIMDNERLKVSFVLLKENGEWSFEDFSIIDGNMVDYAEACMYKTMGRFPEVSKHEIVDYTICEYVERLYDFGIIPGA